MTLINTRKSYFWKIRGEQCSKCGHTVTNIAKHFSIKHPGAKPPGRVQVRSLCKYPHKILLSALGAPIRIISGAPFSPMGAGTPPNIPGAHKPALS